jgi:imidazolonepropionase-like amidohydrolase
VGVRYAFRNALVIDGLGGSERGATVLVEDTRIVAVGSGFVVPTDIEQVWDLGGRAILPGLIDCHTHHVGGDVLPVGGYAYARRLDEPGGIQALRGVEALRRTLLAGVTTVRDLGGAGWVDINLRDAVDSGLVAGPRMLVAGLGLTPTGGHAFPRAMNADGREAVIQAVREHVKRGVDWLKLLGVTGGTATPGIDPMAAQYHAEEVEAAVSEARRWAKPTAAHAHGLEGIRNAVQAEARTIEHGTDLDEATADEMAARDIYLCPTLLGNYYTERLLEEGRLPENSLARRKELEVKGYRIPDLASGLRRVALAQRVGVKLITGSDCGGNAVATFGTSGTELVMLNRAGLSPMEAIVAATSRSAEALGLSGVTGALRPGLAADLLVVNGNPLDDIRVLAPLDGDRIATVVRDGRVVKWEGESRI